MKKCWLFFITSLLLSEAAFAAPYAWFRLDEVTGVLNGTAGEVVDEQGNITAAFAVGTGAGVDTTGAQVCNGVFIPSNTSNADQYAIDSGIDMDGALGPVGTISFWYKSGTDWNGGGDRMLVDASTTENNKYFYLALMNTGKLRFRLEDSADGDFQLDTAVLGNGANTWQHIAITWDLPSDKMEVFVNGASEGSNTGNTTGAFGPLGTIYFGDNRSTYHPSGTANSANGVIDEIRIYQTVRSAAEITDDMNSTHLCASQLVAEWRMDESLWTGASGDVSDELGALNVTSVNGPATSLISPALAGSPGTCRYGVFDGANDYIDLTGMANLTGSFTISAWIYADETGNDQRIFADDESNSGGFAFSLGDGGNGKLRFFSRNVSPVVVDTRNSVISAGQWYHVAAVHDAVAKTRQIYVNGSAVELSTGSNQSTYTGTWGADGGVASIGGETDSAGGEAVPNWRFNGNLDEVRVYGAALTAAQINLLMNQTHACPMQPATEYRFDECSYSGVAGEVADTQGAYPATPYNGVNSNMPGVLGNFLDETINTHQVRVVSSIPMNTVWSVSAWFKMPFVTTQRYHVLGSMDGGGDIMYLDRNANFRWGVYTPSGGVASGGYEFGSLGNGWHQLALVGNDQGANGQTTLYIDGALVETVNLQAQGNLKYFGTSYDSANSSSAQGFGTALDEFLVFNEELGATDILSIYQNQQAGLNFDGTSRSASPCGGGLDHFNINVGAGSASTCAPFSFSITAEDSSNNPVTDYSGTVDISTSTSHGNFAVSSATNAISPNPDADDNGAVSYLFDSADNGQIDLTLDNAHAETLTISVSDTTLSIASTSSNVSFSENAFVIEDNDGQIAGDNVPVAGRNHAYRIRMVRQDSTTGICATATDYDGAKDLKLWRTQNVADPSANNPSLDGDSLPDTDPGPGPGSENGTITFSAGVADVLLTTSDIGKFTIELADISKLFSDTTIAGTSAEQTIRPFGIGIDFSGLRTADFADNGAVDDSTGSDISYAAGSAGSVFTQAGENFSTTVSGVLWEAADDSDDDGVPDAGAFLGNNSTAPAFGAEGETVTLSASLVAPVGATLGSLSGAVFNSFSAGTQTATMTYSNVGIIDFAATLSDGDYFGSGVNLTGTAANVGRFNPYQYALTSSLVNDACVAGSFTYARQPFTASATIEAQNKAGVRSDGFRDGYATLDVASELTFQNSETGSAFDLQTVSLTESFSSGTIGSAQFDLALRYDMGLQDKAVTLVQLTASSDEVTTISGAPLSLGSTEVRFGRLTLENVYGSELIDLTMPMQTEYYDGSNFVVNSQDNCTTMNSVSTLPGSSDVVVTPALSGGSSSVTIVSSGASAGILDIKLTAPGAGNYGDITLEADLVHAAESWLQFDWDGDGNHDNNPAARATFGIYSGDSKQIYRRQIFQ
jgi:MSHA biogenesis protein MshQ